MTGLPANVSHTSLNNGNGLNKIKKQLLELAGKENFSDKDLELVNNLYLGATIDTGFLVAGLPNNAKDNVDGYRSDKILRDIGSEIDKLKTIKGMERTVELVKSLEPKSKIESQKEIIEIVGIIDLIICFYKHGFDRRKTNRYLEKHKK